MDKINWQNLPNTTTPITAENLNLEESNAETAINAVETSASTNLTNATKGYQTTQAGESFTLTDSAGVKGKIDVTNGKTEQATYTGKNLFNKNGNLIADNRLNTSGGATSAEGQYISEYIPITAGLSYTKNSPTEDAYHRICFYSSNEVSGFISASNDNTNTAPENATYVRFCGMTEELDTTQFEQSSSVTSYEPYVGGKSSPSPSYPQTIRNVGDDVNLFNLDNSLYPIDTDSTIIHTFANETVTLNGSLTSKRDTYLIGKNSTSNYICTLKPNTTYTILIEIVSGTFTGAHQWIIRAVDARNYIVGNLFQPDYYNNNSIRTFTTGATAVNIMGVLLYNNDASVTYTNLKFRIKLVEGSEIASYTLYNKSSMNVNAETKNKFTGWTRNLQTNSTNGTRATISNALSSKLCEIEPNTSYRMSGIATGNYGKNKFIAYYTKGKGYISRTGSSNVAVITNTTPENAYYCALGIASAFSDAQTMENFINDCANIQLEKGSSTTTYQPYGKDLATFPFVEGQRLHEGDYLAEDGIHSNSTTITFNGTENWQKSSKTTVNRYYINQVINTIDNAQTVDLVSNYFKCITPAQSDSDGIGMAKFNYRGIMINFELSDTDFDTLEEFKQWLVARNTAGNPLKVEYKLAEEIVTPYTAEQQEAYYKLKHLQMYKGYTDIDCTDEMKPSIKANYLYNNDINNTFGSIIDGLEERVHLLETEVSE